ncbi:hypothetical protein LJC74_06875 [Eubacteriales bacterium OttesenSCG-928-A19]|nr:hypothetical protein [Eubacteriales bacterium OttesenSCG-928-A19]
MDTLKSAEKQQRYTQKIIEMWIIAGKYGIIQALKGVKSLRDQKVAGSNPVTSTKKTPENGRFQGFFVAYCTKRPILLHPKATF